ncbi:hypothetical protein QFC19_003555 [Naganishia cerealis]|uniref:Uncharacterized protein n=1 Tax=Naganishia cerealis TaxID=610337 RepID=A0ACC2W2F7_9TREE|nr:hypothetical protein QFC19_003555 [Naganishia cerealis]
MTALPVPQLKEGGVGADGTSKEITAANKSQAHLKNAMRMATIAAIPFIASMPAGLTFYWTFSNSLTLLQAATLKNGTVRRLLGIPQPPPQPKFKGVEIEKPPTLMDTARAGLGLITDRWSKAKEDAEAYKKSGSGGSAAKKPTAQLRYPGLEQSEIIREATPFPAGESTSSATAAASSPTLLAAAATAGVPPVASKTGSAASARKSVAQVKTMSPAQAEKEARVAAARLRRQRK